MVHLITGPIDSGKTTRMRQIYKILGQGDGFLLNKHIRDGIHIGQRIERLRSGRTMDFSYKTGYIPEEWDECVRHCDYSFSARGFTFAKTSIDEILDKGVEPVFVDEIGPLELSGGGFHGLLWRCLDSGAELYLCVRDACVEEVRETFGINEAEIIKV